MGLKKSAAAPAPLVEPDVVPDELPPASVMTVRLGWTRRILLLFWSATKTLPEVPTATPRGLLKSAAVPTPFVEPDELPASVMTLRLGKMRRILWLLRSATKTLPEVSTATLRGQLKSAAVPTPLVEPDKVPDELPPASVMTSRLGWIRRILLLFWSATYTSTLPEVPTATPEGLLKSAAVPTPSVEPDELPASVMTLRLGKMRRILWLLRSATKTLPEVSTATPKGLLKSAAVPTPLVEPDVVPDELPPANVMAVRLGRMRRIMLLLESATNTLPELCTAIPLGWLKSAAVPTPGVEPDVVPDALPPASVRTVCASARVNARNMQTTTSFEDIRWAGAGERAPPLAV